MAVVWNWAHRISEIYLRKSLVCLDCHFSAPTPALLSPFPIRGPSSQVLCHEAQFHQPRSGVQAQPLPGTTGMQPGRREVGGRQAAPVPWASLLSHLSVKGPDLWCSWLYAPRSHSSSCSWSLRWPGRVRSPKDKPEVPGLPGQPSRLISTVGSPTRHYISLIVMSLFSMTVPQTPASVSKFQGFDILFTHKEVRIYFGMSFNVSTLQ